MARKASSTLTPVFALVSINGTPYSYKRSTLEEASGASGSPRAVLWYLCQLLSLLRLHGPLRRHVRLSHSRDRDRGVNKGEGGRRLMSGGDASLTGAWEARD